MNLYAESEYSLSSNLSCRYRLYLLFLRRTAHAISNDTNSTAATLVDAAMITTLRLSTLTVPTRFA